MSMTMVATKRFRDLKAAGKPIREEGDYFVASPERAVELEGLAESVGFYFPMDETLTTNDLGQIGVAPATDDSLGGVIVDGTTITVDSDGTIHAATIDSDGK